MSAADRKFLDDLGVKPALTAGVTKILKGQAELGKDEDAVYKCLVDSILKNAPSQATKTKASATEDADITAKVPGSDLTVRIKRWIKDEKKGLSLTPKMMLTCHCRYCARWTGAVNLATLWPMKCVDIIDQEGNLVVDEGKLVNKSAVMVVAPDAGKTAKDVQRIRCGKTGAPLAILHELQEMVDVPAGLIGIEENFKKGLPFFKSECAINCADPESVKQDAKNPKSQMVYGEGDPTISNVFGYNNCYFQDLPGGDFHGSHKLMPGAGKIFVGFHQLLDDNPFHPKNQKKPAADPAADPDAFIFADDDDDEDEPKKEEQQTKIEYKTDEDGVVWLHGILGKLETRMTQKSDGSIPVREIQLPDGLWWSEQFVYNKYLKTEAEKQEENETFEEYALYGDDSD